MVLGSSEAAATRGLQQLVQLASHAMARAGLVHAFGHVSIRIDDSAFLVSAAGPLGLAGERQGSIVPICGPLPDGILGEVRAHQSIYRKRGDVNAICRIMPPALMALSTQGITPVPRHGLGACFAPAAPLWNDPSLIRSEAQAEAVARTLGETCAVVMRGNGAIVVADSIEKAATLAWLLEDAARVEERVRMVGGTRRLSDHETAARETLTPDIIERMWTYLTYPERFGSYDGGR